MDGINWIIPKQRVLAADPDAVAKMSISSVGKKLVLRLTLLPKTMSAMSWTAVDRFVVGYAEDFSKVVVRKVDNEDGYKLSKFGRSENYALNVRAPHGLGKVRSMMIKDEDVDGDRERDLLVVDTPWLMKAE